MWASRWRCSWPHVRGHARPRGFQHKRFTRWRKTGRQADAADAERAITAERAGAGTQPAEAPPCARIWRGRRSADHGGVFSSDWSIRRQLTAIAQRRGFRGADSGGKSDVLLSQLRGRFCIAGCCGPGQNLRICAAGSAREVADFLMSGVCRSATLTRAAEHKLRLMVRFDKPAMAEQAGALFAEALRHCREVTREEWRNSRTSSQ